MFEFLILLLLSLTLQSTANPAYRPIPTTTSSSIVSKTDFSASEITCFPAHAPQTLHGLFVEDCRLLARDVANLSRSGRKYIFGTPDIPNVDFTVPQTFSRKTCVLNVLEIDSSQPVSDAFTLRYLSQKLLRMAETCVLQPPHLGGEAPIGARGVLEIIVLGADLPIRFPILRLGQPFDDLLLRYEATQNATSMQRTGTVLTHFDHSNTSGGTRLHRQLKEGPSRRLVNGT